MVVLSGSYSAYQAKEQILHDESLIQNLKVHDKFLAQEEVWIHYKVLKRRTRNEVAYYVWNNCGVTVQHAGIVRAKLSWR